MATTYKIHPSIGLARVGNSDEFYIGPETAGGLPINPDGKPFSRGDFRDGQHRIKRQAARFQVYRYEHEGDPGRPISLKDPDVAGIVWTMHVANKKAAWYEFSTWQGQYGYTPNHAMRNPDVKGDA